MEHGNAPTNHDTRSRFEGSAEEIDNLSPETWTIAVDVYADTLRTLWPHVEAHAITDNRLQQLAYGGGDIDSWLASKRSFYATQMPERPEQGQRRILQDVALMLDAAVQTMGEGSALRVLQRAAIERALHRSAVTPQVPERPKIPQPAGALARLRARVGW